MPTEKTYIWALSLVFLIALSATAAEPDCEGFLCGSCGSSIYEIAETEEVITVGPTLGMIWDTVWASCGTGGNCCATSTCTLSWSTTTVQAGLYNMEAGASLGIPLPGGYTLGANFVLKYQGQTQRTIQAGVVTACNLGNCRKTTQEIGPGYTTIIRTVDAEKVCHRPTYTDAGTLTCDIKDDCTGIIYERESMIKYLSHESHIRGVCGLPVSPTFCPACSDPQNPDCP